MVSLPTILSRLDKLSHNQSDNVDKFEIVFLNTIEVEENDERRGSAKIRSSYNSPISLEYYKATGDPDVEESAIRTFLQKETELMLINFITRTIV